MTIAFDTGIHPVARGVRIPVARVSREARPGAVTVLTARGRFVVGLLAALALSLGGVLLGSTVAATQDVSHAAVETVVVQPGDTLWAIATQANPGGDIRKTIADIVRLNAIEAGSSLPAGVSLSVPVYE